MKPGSRCRIHAYLERSLTTEKSSSMFQINTKLTKVFCRPKYGIVLGTSKAFKETVVHKEYESADDMLGSSAWNWGHGIKGTSMKVILVAPLPFTWSDRKRIYRCDPVDVELDSEDVEDI